ncbi:MAG: hypothetical protein JNL36_02500 [Candidatus Kapabacteria bacterium]|nr:hypothetical protein [Candidatus Kapabacteria bacterium]
MNRILLLLAFIVLPTLQIFAKETTAYSFPKTISNELEIESNLPQGYEMIGSTYGDLNKDEMMDLALIVADTREDVEFDTPVYLGIYFKNAKGSYDLNVVSTTAMLCFKCGGVMGNPFAGIEITPKGILQIHHYGGSVERWGYIDKYRYQNGAFHLIGHTYTESSPDSPKTKSTDTNLLTGDQEIIEDPNIASKKDNVKKTRSKVKVKPLKTIDSYSPGNL